MKKSLRLHNVIKKRLRLLLYATACISLSLLLALYLFPSFEKIEKELLHQLEKRSGLSFSMQQIEWEWSDWHWGLSLHDVNIQRQENGTKPFKIGRVHIAVDLWASLKQTKLIFADIAIQGIDLTLERRSETWQLQEWEQLYTNEMQTQTSLQTESWLNLQPEVSISDMNLIIHSDGQEQAALKDLSLHFEAGKLFAQSDMLSLETKGMLIFHNTQSAFTLQSETSQAALPNLFKQDDLAWNSLRASVWITPLDLASSAKLITTLLPSLPITPWLKKLTPVGKIKNLQLTTNAQEVQLSAELDRVSWQASGDVPAISGLSGKATLSPHQGELLVHSHNGFLDFGNLFAMPLAFNRLEAKLAYKRTENGQWQINLVDGLFAGKVNLSAKGSLSFTEDHPQDASLDLSAEARGFDISRVHQYLPIGIMDPSLVRWLTQALQIGHVKDAILQFHGPLANFPFTKGDGQFTVKAHAEHAQVAFHPEWLPLDIIEAQLYFVSDSLRLSSIKAFSQQLRLAEAFVEIPHFLATPVILKVHGKVEGRLEDASRYIALSPLKAKLLHIIDSLQPQGPLKLSLDFSLPLDGSQEKVAGSLDVENATIFHQFTGIKAQSIAGPLNFSEQGLESFSFRLLTEGRPGIIQARRQKDRLAIDLDSAVAKGKLIWPLQAREEPLHMDFEYVELALQKTDVKLQEASFSKPADNFLDPQSLPAVKLTCRSCRLGGKDWGRVYLVTKAMADGLELEAFDISKPSFSFTAKAGYWRRAKQADESFIAGELHVKETGDTLETFGYPAKIVDAQADGELELRWLGPPTHFCEPNLHGKAKFHADEGYISEPGPLTSSLLGLLNLSLNDAYKNKLTFKSISGELEFKDGTMQILDSSLNLHIAEFKSQGTFSLTDYTLDQKLSLIPNLNAPLPSLIFTFINPVLGATLWWSDQMKPRPSESLWNRMISQHYHLTGTVEKPEVTLLKVGL